MRSYIPIIIWGLIFVSGCTRNAGSSTVTTQPSAPIAKAYCCAKASTSGKRAMITIAPLSMKQL